MAILRLVVGIATDSAVLGKAKSALYSTSEGKWTFKGKGLQEKADRLGALECQKNPELVDNSNGPRKRLRLTTLPTKGDTQRVDVHPLVLEVYRLLGNREVDNLGGLSLVAGDGFNKITEAERCIAVRDLGLLSCALAGSLTESRGVHLPKKWGSYKCSYCDAETGKPPSAARLYADDKNSELFRTLEVFLKLDKFQRSIEVRVWAIMSLKRMLNHTHDLTHLSLDRSALGKWCINALQSSRREIRIAAGYVALYGMGRGMMANFVRRTLLSFVGFNHDAGVLDGNRVTILGFLKALSEGDDPSLQETCVLAWSQFGRYT